jgi:uncharacterized repeat protein (TIGR02543 family)
MTNDGGNAEKGIIFHVFGGNYCSLGVIYSIMDSVRRRPVNRIMRPAGVFILAFFLFGCDNIYHDLVHHGLVPPKIVPLSDENRITSFEINGQIGKAVIDNDNNTIRVSVKEGTDLTEVIPRISVSPGATLFPLNMAMDLSIPVDFLVTSGKGTERKYTWISPYKVINIAAIKGITVPATGETPVTTITETEQYAGTVEWEPVHSTFETMTEYTATITLTPKHGYTLQGVTENFFTVAGVKVSATNTENSGMVTAVFSATDAMVVDIAAIEGVAVPATGETPVTTITETEQYTGTVEWGLARSDSANVVQFVATITLTAKHGYTLKGVPANFFTVEGAISVKNNANSGVVTVIFPAIAFFTVTFDANNATNGTAPDPITANAGSAITLPRTDGLTHTGYTFDGWNTISNGRGTNYYAGSSYTPDGNITLYARWNPITYTVAYDKNADDAIGRTENSSHTYDAEKTLTSNGYTRTYFSFAGWNTEANGNGTNYSDSQDVKNLTTTNGDTVRLYAVWTSLTLAEKLAWLSTNAVSDTNYTIEVTSDETISPTTLSYSERTNIGITLISTDAERTIDLSTNGSLFTVGNGVTLILDSGVTLQGRSSADNKSLVMVAEGGTLVMNAGAKIKDNKTSSSNGGGVYVGSGTFTMNGGEISNSSQGVYVGSKGTFTMNGGEISGNTSNYSNGGGVYLSYGTFIMNGGEISGNTSLYGGGVFMSYGTFTMNGGEISGNHNGGGVYVASGTFTMNGGEISGNTSIYGGVSVWGTFRIVTGTIYGSDEADTSLRNTGRSGAALFRYGGTAEFGTFSGETWNRNGDLVTTDNTIKVVNGVLQ